MKIGERLKQSWNVLTNRDPTINDMKSSGAAYANNPDRNRFSRGNERSIMTSILLRIALDVASMDFKHCIVNGDGFYINDVESDLNECLTISPNMDQTPMAFMQDVVMKMLDKGAVAIVPIDVDVNRAGEFDISSLRACEVLEWLPDSVKVRAYNEKSGQKQDIIVSKHYAAIIENPLYAVINEPNSVVKRLSKKLSLLDMTDEQTASGKLDLVIQIPYSVNSSGRKAQADIRRVDLESQLVNSKYGIAYLDGTEKITQLNRSVENNLMPQIEYLMTQTFAQLGMTQSILDGTADDQVLQNYYSRTIEPIVVSIVSEMRRKFISKDARKKKLESIHAFRDPFKLVPASLLAEMADSLNRNEILSSNEIRQILGRKPSTDPKADQLVNSNLHQPNIEQPTENPVELLEEVNQNG